MTRSLMTLDALADRITRLSEQRDAALEKAAELASELNDLRRELRSRADQLVQRSYTRGNAILTDVMELERSQDE